MGCLLCAGKATPCSAIASFAANSAPWIDVVPVLCGPMCSSRLPAGSGCRDPVSAGSGAGAAVSAAVVWRIEQSVSMVRGR